MATQRSTQEKALLSAATKPGWSVSQKRRSTIQKSGKKAPKKSTKNLEKLAKKGKDAKVQS